MTKPTTEANLQTQKAQTIDLFNGDIESARKRDVVLLNLLDDQSGSFTTGVASKVLHDMEDHSVEDTTMNGDAQSDLSGGAQVTTLAINTYRTIPAYFHYVIHGEASRIDFVSEFLTNAPMNALLEVESAAMVALRSIGSVSGHYRQMSGTDSEGNANSVPTVADYKVAIAKLVKEKKFKKSELVSVSDSNLSLELNNIFGLYSAEASGAMGDMAKLNGYARQILGVPHYEADVCKEKELVIFQRRAVAWAIRNGASLGSEDQASRNRTYYGINISYGVVARQDSRAVVMQDGAAWAA